MSLDWVTGAGMMFRKGVLDEIGLLDARYFLHLDAVDFCFWARHAGWPACSVPASTVAHLQARATGITDARTDKRRLPDCWLESRRRFFMRSHGRSDAVLADQVLLEGYATIRVWLLIQRRRDEEPPYFWRDFLRNSIFVKGFET